MLIKKGVQGVSSRLVTSRSLLPGPLFFSPSPVLRIQFFSGFPLSVRQSSVSRCTEGGETEDLGQTRCYSSIIQKMKTAFGSIW